MRYILNLLLLSLFSFPAVTGAENNGAAAVLEQALARFEQVKDYRCFYIKQEKAIDNLGPQKIWLYFRKPFDVRLDWGEARDKVTQSVVYREGYNKNKLLVRKSGLLGLRTWALDPKGALALSDSAHPITEVGFGKMLQRMADDLAKGQIEAKDHGYEDVEGRRARKIELISHAGAGVHYAKRSIIWLDPQLLLPVKHEHYNAAGQLFERHVYKEIEVNVGLGDDLFKL